MILLLEADRDRVQRFSEAVRLIDPTLDLCAWKSARQMASEMSKYLIRARLNSLGDNPGLTQSDDPGDEVDVVKQLVQSPPYCPVILHGSTERSDRMAGEFERGSWKWKYHRVEPLGDDWIEASWAEVARKILEPSERRHR